MSIKQKNAGPYSLVLVRHGETEWNGQDRFTGWTDIDLTEHGALQARKAGQVLAREGWAFDMAYTSLLRRAILSQWLMLEELKQSWVPLQHDWRLNGRHYGDLTGKLRTEATRIYGHQEVLHWCRSYCGQPPAIPGGDARDAILDRRYAHVSPWRLPRTESLRAVVSRVNEFWLQVILPATVSGQRVIVCAHGSVIRALIKILDGISEYEAAQLNVPNGIPLIYWFDQDMKPTCRCYLEVDSADDVDHCGSRRRAC
ncbi:2,3-bisphosphoglycerate-dependent phosphoglycerate mutase [Paraburkholderia tropica]|uniref:2,3-bisphosphoglycerate-dependent phosphoglycerate mutase n=1 Tax=Paraburkholderia tropica TaxID=92647 RepID=UPI002AAF40F9|nr:2,3-bisphosphoglycerate-dependent phosphoglycerate mutase [Paraburkholderia tropica]